MKLTTPIMIALAPFVATPSYALQLKPVSADVRQPKGIPAAIDAANHQPADKDQACMKALLIPEARMMFVSLGADGAPSYTLHHPHHLTQYPQELP